MPLHPPERRPCPVRKPPGHRSECRCAKFTPVGPDVFAVRHRGGGGQTRAGRMPSAVAFPAADGRQDRSDDENAKRQGGEVPSLLSAQAGRTRLQADVGRKRPRPLAAHGREELPPRRGTEKGRAYPTAAARDREGRSRRGGAIKVSARPSLRRTAGRSFLRGEAPRKDGRT